MLLTVHTLCYTVMYSILIGFLLTAAEHSTLLAKGTMLRQFAVHHRSLRYTRTLNQSQSARVKVPHS